MDRTSLLKVGEKGNGHPQLLVPRVLCSEMHAHSDHGEEDDLIVFFILLARLIPRLFSSYFLQVMCWGCMVVLPFSSLAIEIPSLFEGKCIYCE